MACIFMSESAGMYHKARHIDIKARNIDIRVCHHDLCDLCKDRIIELEKIDTIWQVADLWYNLKATP